MEIETDAFDVVGTGFAVLDRIYATEREPTAQWLGGSCGNVLVSLAMLKRNVAPVLSLGHDQVGDTLLGEFRRAGAEIRFIRRSREGRSPILAQHVDLESGHHRFAFRCPETDMDLPRYEPIRQEDLKKALPVITRCAIFYADRVSETIVDAMERAAAAGALVYFEPSTIGDEVVFRRAVAVTTVLKYSMDRLADLTERFRLPEGAVSIMTHGSAGLEVRQDAASCWCRAYPARTVRDTCGSGDMVSVGLIDWLLTRDAGRRKPVCLDEVLQGIEAGQRLAAENCAYVGARGLFVEKGPGYVRAVLAGATC